MSPSNQVNCPEQGGDNWPEFDEDTARIYVRRIGNLALMLAKNNSDLRSSNFKTKKAVYNFHRISVMAKRQRSCLRCRKYRVAFIDLPAPSSLLPD